MPAPVSHTLPRAAASGALATAESIAATAAELVACGSLEMGADTPEDARRVAELLPTGTPVYVNHLPSRDLEHSLPALVALRQAGLEPVPHIAARRVASREQVQSFLQRRREDGRRRQGAADRRRRGRAGGSLRRRGGAAARPAARRLRHPAGRARRLSRGPSAHRHRNAARRARREAGAGPRAGARPPTSSRSSRFAPNRIAEYCADLARRAPRCAGLRRPGRTREPGRPAALRAALRRRRLAARAAVAGHGRGAARHARRPERAAHRAGPP